MQGMNSFIKNYTGPNPFKDHQARTFDNDKLVKEFYPTSFFWSLFNDQHEILVGRRGSGKTILLKMMRYSLLKQIDDDRAKKIISEKKYISIFAPTNLEFLGSFNHQEVPDRDKLLFFQFAFNCLLSRAFIYEINSVISEKKDIVSMGIKSKTISKIIASIWFPKIEESEINQIEDLDREIINIYENTEIISGFKNVPKVFKSTICRPIQAVSPLIFNQLGFKKEPTWLVCIDEAEFLTPELQRCINSLFRADSKGIVIKMATMPYHHLTKETLVNNIFAESNGNDFSYRKLDMKEDSNDFISVTNNLCKTRFMSMQTNNVPNIGTLESFVGMVGSDDLVDYYQAEINKGGKKSKKLTQEELLEKIIANLSIDRQQTINNKEKRKEKEKIRKEIYDKFAPIFFTREMYKISKKGNAIPGWYAGPKMIRKLSEGNPRQFIRIMNVLFEKARETELTPTTQHKVIYNFTKQDCNATNALPIHGPDLYRILTNLSEQLKSKTHDGHMIYTGNSFKFRKGTINNNPSLIKCLELGIGYLKISVGEESYINGINESTQFSLSNCFSAFFWIPLRRGDFPKLTTPFKQQAFKIIGK